MRLTRQTILVLLILASSSMSAAPTSVSIVIKMAVVADSSEELRLEIAMQNISKERVGYGIVCGWPMWATNFVFDVRDAEGHVVHPTPAGENLLNGATTVTCAIGDYLEPRQTLRQRVILNEVFSFVRPGEYTVRAAFHGTDSNTIRFRVPLPKTIRNPLVLE